MFYLNRNNPAQCNGTITSYSYCYYSPAMPTGGMYEATIGVYRSIGGDRFQLLDGSTMTITLDGSTSLQPGFACQKLNISSGAIRVQIGDVLGACIYDRNSPMIEQLNLVGRATDTVHTLLGMGIDNDCRQRSRLPSPVDSLQLMRHSGRILHLYANIGKLLSTLLH